MILTDFKCSSCGKIKEVSKKSIIDSFSAPVCEECNVEMVRVYAISAIDVAAGMVGNANTGYQKEFVYKSSKFGKLKGEKI